MTARLIRDDALQSYSRAEVRFLWQLAARLPDHLVLRASHERQPPAPLNLALDLRIVSQIKAHAIGTADESLIRRYGELLTQRAAAMLAEFTEQLG